MKQVSTWARRVAGVAGWVLAVGCVGLLVAVGIGPRTGAYRTLTVLTGSMRPGIGVGAVVVDRPEPARKLRVGQIVTYRIPVEDHRIISHRVVRVVQGGDRPIFQTQGDANNAPDYWLAQVSGATVWHVAYVVPGLGRALHWLRQPTAHTVTVIVLPAAVGLLWIVGIWREGDPDDGADEGPAGVVTAHAL